MIDTLKIYNELKENLSPEAALKIAEILGTVYSEISDSVTKKEFSELSAVVEKLGVSVNELSVAQKKTEKRVEELAVAQKKTEKRVEELAVAQKKTEERVEELAVAQKKTEKRVEELAVAQKKTEKRVEELAVAQKKTEQNIQKLTVRVDNLTKEVGGISNTIGYRLEDEAYPKLKKILKERYGIQVEKLYRKNIVYSTNRFDEINIYGEGKQNGNPVIVIGECKAQFGPRDVEKYLKLLKRVSRHLKTDVFPLALAYHYHPQAEIKLKEDKIPVFWSYELLV